MSRPTLEPPAPRPGPFLRGWALAAGVVALLALSAWFAGRWLWWKAPPAEGPNAPPDPRLTYDGPFRNVRPDVGYVGDAACAGCHPVEAATFREHPMGRSIVPAADAARDAIYRRPAPFERNGSRFAVERRGDRLWNVERALSPEGEALAETATEIHYVIGSGRRGHSYLSDLDGYLFQTSISWYSQAAKWGLSPGFRDGHRRPIPPECLSCHAGGARPVEYSANRYERPPFTRTAIGCERCHGPGELHVESRGRDELPGGRFDPTIVNPRHLEPGLREQVCHQCHLQGKVRVLRRGRGPFDYRPGLRLGDFWTVFVPAAEQGERRKAVSHVELMAESKCFQASGGRMGCVTCHDPHEHVPAARRVEYYRDRCLQCHAEARPPCRLDAAARAKENGDSCIDCHMKPFASTDIAHTASTDHRIRRRPATAEAPAAVLGVPLVAFEGEGRPGAGGADADRDLGLALVEAARLQEPPYVRALPHALGLIRLAARTLPDDVPLLQAQAEAALRLGRAEESLEAVERLLARAPDHEWAVRQAALIRQDLGRDAEALADWQKAIALNPWNVQNHYYAALIHVRRRDWERAAGCCADALRIDPSYVKARVIAAHCHRKRGRAADAERERRIVEASRAPDLAEFRAWFDKVAR